jgi:hypothetical protein
MKWPWALGVVLSTAVLVPVAVRLLDLRPTSLASVYAADVKRHEAEVARSAPPVLVTEAELASLPPLVQTYLRRAGVVGKPHVRSFHAVFAAQFRRAPDAPWMAASVDQHNFFVGPAPARLFFMRASQWGIPFAGLHRYVGDAATMQVRIAGLFEIVNASGAEMTQGETVTLFNDICVLAPAVLVDAPVSWQTLGDRQVTGTYTNAGKTISAVLTFDDAGDLVGFVSDDRYQSDGKTHKLLPWSTPLRNYRDFGGVRLAAEGDAYWRDPDGEWPYGRFVLQRITYNEGVAGEGR